MPRFRRHLVDDGICGDDELNLIDTGALETVQAALKTALSADSPSSDELERDVYATPLKFPG